MKELPIQLKLPSNFLNEEIRCDYYITSDMKKVWSVQLDLLSVFDTVCRENDIKYYVCAGTLLGAMRHKGYIPWDDDVDVMVFREDYDKLCKLALTSFKDPYFFQTEYTDPGSIRGHAQLRNSETTAIVEAEQNNNFPFNQGIFIDIFVLDNVPDDDSLRMKYFRKARKLKKLYTFIRDVTWGINRSSGIVGFVKETLISTKKILGLSFESQNPNSAYCKWEKHIKKYDSIKTEWVMIMALDSDRFCWKREWFCEPEYVPFEFLEVPIPKYYDEVLIKTYKNWHVMVHEASGHKSVIYNTERSYKDLQ